jgi:hypothetical protein
VTAQTLLEALMAARDILIAFGAEAGRVPQQSGYSATMTDAERTLARGAASAIAIEQQEVDALTRAREEAAAIHVTAYEMIVAERDRYAEQLAERDAYIVEVQHERAEWINRTMATEACLVTRDATIATLTRDLQIHVEALTPALAHMEEQIAQVRAALLDQVLAIVEAQSGSTVWEHGNPLLMVHRQSLRDRIAALRPPPSAGPSEGQ